jgi:predicted nucleotidyltransferase
VATTEFERRSWTATGADTAAQNTYASVKAALAPVLERRSIDVFLQGSYANSTNIRADSDVDIVVMTRETFQGSASRLSAAALDTYRAFPAAIYTETDLRAEVTAALVDYYGASRVHPRNKCIRVDKRDGYVDADIVPCLEYHYYPYSHTTSTYIEGIVIHPRQGVRIINYPKEHIENGRTKNDECSDRYKPTVRQVKRLRNRAVAMGVLRNGQAPGYLLECMVYNVPPSEFAYDDAKRLWDVTFWLKLADKSGFLSCDRIHQLFVDDPGNFTVGEAQAIADALWQAV